MKNIFVKPNRELTVIGGTVTPFVSLFVAAVLAILFAAVHAAFDAVPTWVIAVSFVLLAAGVIVSRRLNNWKWLTPAALSWIVSSFCYFLGRSSAPQLDPAAMWNFSELGVMLLSMSMLMGSAASVIMPIALRSIANENS